MPYFTVITDLAVIIDNLDIHARNRLTHRAGPDFYTRDIGNDIDGFGLSIPVMHHGAGDIFPHSDRFRVQRFAGAQRMAQRTEVVTGYIHLREQPVDRGRRTKCGDTELPDKPQVDIGIELRITVIEHHCSSEQPLREQHTPGGLGPAGIGQCPVNIVFRQVHPVFACHHMAQRIAVIARHHLR